MISPLLRFAGSTVTAAARRRSVIVLASAQPATPLLELQQQHQQQRRSFWMDVVRIKKQQPRRSFKDKDKGNSGNGKFQMMHEDPEQVVRRHTNEVRADGESLLDLMFYNDRHEKAWMKRKRMDSLRRYEFDKKHVTDLAKYISFVHDYNDEGEEPSKKK
mmetsp:Transcript_18153/g.39578  ORF Transcript_18153/g.39578 Transcript_18153/m.39578 type:complete len:160 (+) Transcript_18153:168-647(+)|eukprot:CAMPEP_0168192978 /NCGR_PEP_ID=MMETSP0139_2-20121125/18343_1 /TAXON_ID=44445 /ORGANISM="Pseudo-nitzschia australis, Strain 10249 10 AB" /LENGTH=159 /DNA_ID=CAMNT_0008116267 /DNA_START=119 /DNA_END=598 /DNA_ORIENTATION=-